MHISSKYYFLPLLSLVLINYTNKDAFSETLTNNTKGYSWKTFRNGYFNNGLSSINIKDIKNEQIVKNFPTKGLIWGTAVIDEDNNVYVGGTDKNFYAFDKSGNLKWTYRIFDKADSLIDSSAALTPSGKVIVPGGDGYLHALDKNTGKALWTFKAHHSSESEHQEGSLVNSFEGNVQIGPNNLIYAGSDNGHIYAIDDNGKEIWNFKTDMMIWSTPSFSRDGKWMAFGSLDGNIYLLDPDTGKLLDKKKLAGDVKSSPATNGTDTIYVGTSGNTFYKLLITDTLKFKEDWNFLTNGEIYSSPALKDNKVIFGSLDGSFYCLSTEGKLLWKYSTYSPISSSPLVTSDGVILFGAANGKLYALDLEQGERIWSFKTTETNFKSNLDASVSVTDNGTLWLGSYNGNIYNMSYNYCLSHQNDKRCETGGKIDVPEFVQKSTKRLNNATMIYEENDRNYSTLINHQLGQEEMIRLRLVVKKNGEYIPNADISKSGLKVEISPKQPLDYEVSSDGRFLNIKPKDFYPDNTKFELKVSGKYYLAKNWALDRLRLVDDGNFHTRVNFHTKNKETENISSFLQSNNSIYWTVKSLFLFQPQALDTYTPAALDGQGFIFNAIGFSPVTNKFILMVYPALPTEDGVSLLKEPSKFVILDGTFAGRQIKADGKFKLSAMGGTIDFQKFEIMSGLNDKGNFDNINFTASTSCLSLQGNQSGYQVPMNLVNMICDDKLNLITVGTSKNTSLIKMPNQEINAKLISASNNGNSLNIKLKISNSLVKENHLITAVTYNPDNVVVKNWGAEILVSKNIDNTGITNLNLPLKNIENVNSNDKLQIFIDSLPVNVE